MVVDSNLCPVCQQQEAKSHFAGEWTGISYIEAKLVIDCALSHINEGKMSALEIKKRYARFK